jgi:hypothetical protein
MWSSYQPRPGGIGCALAGGGAAGSGSWPLRSVAIVAPRGASQRVGAPRWMAFGPFRASLRVPTQQTRDDRQNGREKGGQ